MTVKTGNFVFYLFLVENLLLHYGPVCLPSRIKKRVILEFCSYVKSLECTPALVSFKYSVFIITSLLYLHNALKGKGKNLYLIETYVKRIYYLWTIYWSICQVHTMQRAACVVKWCKKKYINATKKL